MISKEEDYIDLVFDSLISGVVVIDGKDHVIVDINETAIKMIGIPKEDVIGKVCHKYICPTEIGHCPVSHPGQLINQSERILLNYKGESVPILKRVKKVEKDGHMYLIESFIDVSNLKEAKEEILIKKGN
ncbi:PAS domain S-box protein [Methanococcoides orientis]|uniref:PAS domain S-box protein n=1 Tax=Methanococcoides orientis TaxID=2822137 RepID=UPI001E5BE107|nr:PAS domain S-box protein [Methanococcoides orientis]UGV41680.1 PAS domain S-box protein [Methanococcoides orientis]